MRSRPFLSRLLEPPPGRVPELPAGLHVVVNSGLDGELRGAMDHERARIEHFLPKDPVGEFCRELTDCASASGSTPLHA